MEVTRTYTHSVVDTVSILVVDVNTSLFITNVKSFPTQTASSDSELLHYIAKELGALLEEIENEFLKGKATVFQKINLNFSEMKYPFHFWDELIFLDTRKLTNNPQVYITEQSPFDRQEYFKTNYFITRFRKQICESASNDEEREEDYLIDFELLTKKTIWFLFKERGIEDENEIENLLARYSSVEDLVTYL
ncbi:hypothetical protein NCAS_0D01520 [Naumovozyma castellii]|uniref:Uncharacterized protein n=1 Tax=Naumovozyma castellii TaxID=27288 RepID=G0VDU4_NAUCA|nr:hypothetical protein NCAS_0D01520 [Naumovozyma castellii CBS 4309]CCC69733.1 hypothetical protein NCAS_0D01520 [Naumovozyma castellii CBS 4309]